MSAAILKQEFKTVNVAGRNLALMLAILLLSMPFRDIELGWFHITEWLVAAFVMVAIANWKKDFFYRWNGKMLRPLVLFVAYTVVINGWYAYALGDNRFLLSSWFFGGCLFFVTALSLGLEKYPKLMLAVLQLGLTITLVFIAGYVLLCDVSTRPYAFYSNYNKLSRIGLMISVVLFILQQRFEMRGVGNVIVLGCALFLAWQVMTRATLIALGVLLFVLLIQNHGKVVLAATLLAVILVSCHHGIRGTSVVGQTDQIEQRFSETDREDNILERGYLALWRNPQYLALGGGDGKYQRFDWLPPHSSSVAIVLPYGLVGFGFLLFFFWRSLRSGGQVLWLLLPLLVHGLVHNDTRSIFYWIIPCLFLVDPMVKETE